MTTIANIYLASRSPQRRKLLEQIGLCYELLDISVDENINGDETPQQLVTRLAKSKAKAGWLSLQQEHKPEVERVARLPVIGADTCITIDAKILGKPRDREHGLSMLDQLSGRTHQVYCAVSIIGLVTENNVIESSSSVQNHLQYRWQDRLQYSLQQEWRVNKSEVTFKKLSSKEIEAYWNTGEPLGKAGAYAVQGLAAQFIRHLSGSYSAVMGLPLFELAELLPIFGISTGLPDMIICK